MNESAERTTEGFKESCAEALRDYLIDRLLFFCLVALLYEEEFSVSRSMLSVIVSYS